MKEIQQKSPGNSESEAVPFAEKLRETLKEEEQMLRPQKTGHGEAMMGQQ